MGANYSLSETVLATVGHVLHMTEYILCSKVILNLMKPHERVFCLNK